MKTLLIHIIFLLGFLSVAQNEINLVLKDNKTFIIQNNKEVETKDFVIHIEKRKVYVFNFKDINYHGEVIGGKSKCIGIYCNRTILRLTTFTLPTDNNIRIKLTNNGK